MTDAERHLPLACAATWRRLANGAANARADRATVAVAAATVFGICSVAWPLSAGRDAATYLMYYLDMWHSRPVYENLMAFRTPVAPLFFGPLLEFAGAAATELVIGLLYVGAASAVYAAGSSWGRRAGLLATAGFLLYIPFAALSDTVSSDSLFGLGIALWLPLLCRAGRVPTWRIYAANAVAVVLLILIRPSAEVFLLLVLLPLLHTRVPWRRRLLFAAAFAVPAFAGVAAWSGYNLVRYDDFTVSRGSGAHMPLYRVWVVDRLVAPDNGPASRQLAHAVAHDLLQRRLYRAYHVDVRRFFASGSENTWDDVIPLSDRTWGWGSDYSTLRAVALEAIARHPTAYARSVVRGVGSLLVQPYSAPAPDATAPPAHPRIRAMAPPQLAPGEVVPGYVVWWLASSPDQRVWWDWTSIAHPVLRFRTMEDRRNYERLQAAELKLERKLPAREGSPRLARALNDITRYSPPLLAWLVVGLLGILVRRPRDRTLLLAIGALGVAVIVGTELGEPPTLQYAITEAPLFVLFGAASLVGSRPHDDVPA